MSTLTYVLVRLLGSKLACDAMAQGPDGFYRLAVTVIHEWARNYILMYGVIADAYDRARDDYRSLWVAGGNDPLKLPAPFDVNAVATVLLRHYGNTLGITAILASATSAWHRAGLFRLPCDVALRQGGSAIVSSASNALILHASNMDQLYTSLINHTITEPAADQFWLWLNSLDRDAAYDLILRHGSVNKNVAGYVRLAATQWPARTIQHAARLNQEGWPAIDITARRAQADIEDSNIEERVDQFLRFRKG